MVPNPPQAGSQAQSGRDEAFADAEPPPPYEPVASSASGSTTLEANFTRPYEVQDSGLYPGASTSRPAQNGFQPPSGPPPRPASASSSPTSFAPPPQHPSHRYPSGGNPQAHIDGVSTFNRPPLPNQTPAHESATNTQPAKYSPSVHPQSGQPLLYKGKLLVYPSGFYCPKCREQKDFRCCSNADTATDNTGYKAYDPSNPHNKCWDKYGKQFTSVLRNSPNFDFDNPTLQRPLPNQRYTASTAPPPPAQHPGYYVAGAPAPVQSPPVMQQPYQQPYYAPQPMTAAPAPFGVYTAANVPNPHMVIGAPPPNALVVQPGDPRIGGRLCFNCQGSGQVPGGFFMLDTETCMTCRGAGRIFF